MRFLPFVAPALLCSAAIAADVSFEGTLEADYGNYLEENFTVNNAANHDLRLKMNIDLDENVRAVVGVASKSAIGRGEVPRVQNKYAATSISSDSARWTPFLFDGVSLEWTVRRDLTFVFGNLTYSFGDFNFYYWRNPDYNAAILTTQGMMGLGARFGDEGFIYIGASDESDHSGRIAATYAIPIPGINQTNNKFTVAPTIDYNKGRGSNRGHNFTFGIDANYSRSYTELNYAVRGIWGIHPSSGNYVNTFTLEPSFNYKNFNLASVCYFALIGGEDGGALTVDETYASDERLVYIEPSYSFNKKFSLGLGFEWHKPGEMPEDNQDIDPNWHKTWFLIAPTGYLYPTAGMALSFWLGYAIKEGYNNPSFGINSSVQF